MPDNVVLASGSAIRRSLLETAGVALEVIPARVDEDAIKAALLAEGIGPRDIADALAEAKARKTASAHPGRLVIGADQTLDFRGGILSKPETPDDVHEQLSMLSGHRHSLHSAAVIFDQGRPVWRQIESATLTMRPLSDQFIRDYTVRNWESIRHSVGGYKIEEEGSRLFSKIDGSHFAVQGLPLLGILAYLSLRGVIEA